MDTYGHLIAGAEAAAVTANADLTAVPAIIAATEATAAENTADFSATGTDGCFPFVSAQDGKRRVDDERRRNEPDRKPSTRKPTAPKKTPQNAGRSDAPRTLVNVRDSTQSGTRTRKAISGRGILNHGDNAENAGKNGVSAGVVSYLYPPACGNDTEDARLAELMIVWQTLDDAAKAELLSVAKTIASRT